MRLIAFAAIMSLGLFPVGGHAQTNETPEEGLSCGGLTARQRDSALVDFTVISHESMDTQYPGGNYVNWTRTTQFEGTLELDYVFGTGDCSASNDGIAFDVDPDAAEVPEPPAPVQEAELMMQAMAACAVETDPLKQAQCLSDAVDSASATAEACRNPVEGEPLPAACGMGSAPPPAQQQQPEVPRAPVEESAVAEIPIIVDMGPEDIDPDFNLDNNAQSLEILRAVSCDGTITVTGSGSGYDQSYQRQPYYNFSIGGQWQSDTTIMGGIGDCSAGVVMDKATRRIRLIVMPGPDNIRMERSYNNFRGVEEQPERAFPGFGSWHERHLGFTAPPGKTVFRAHKVLQPLPDDSDEYSRHHVETEIKFVLDMTPP